MRKLVLAISLLALSAHVLAEDLFPRYKPSSRSPEPIDIRTNAYGFSQSAPDALKVGEIAPDFEVLSPEQTVISSAELRAEGPLVVVFYRGHW